QRIELRGVGILQRFAVTPVTHTFDSVAMGVQECKTFTFSNPGSDTLRITDLYFSSADPDFTFQSMEGRSFSIAPLQSRDISVCFTPRKMGARQANLRVLTDIPATFEMPSRDTSEFNIAITGTGVPFGDLTFEDNLIDSGAVGEEFCTSHTVMNVGQYSITVTSASIVGPDAAEFAFRNATFPFTLEPGAQKDITICTTPGARGLRQASIVAYTTSNSAKDTVTLPVDAYGQIVCAQPSETALFGGEPVLVGETKTMSVTVSNCGDIASVYTAAVIGEGYQIVGDMVTAMIPAGGSHEFSIMFTPSVVGAQTATLMINARDVAPMNIALNGTGGGVTASHNNFAVPETAVGTTQDFTVTVTNNGNVEWSTGTPSIDGGAYSTTSTGLTLAPGASDVITFTFAPASAGTHTGTVTFPTAAPAATPSFSIALSGVGSVASVGRPTVMNGFELEQNYPNPVQPTTSVRFTTPRSAMVSIAVVDMKGETVKTIESANYPTGTHTVQLDASELSAGTYFYVLMSEGVQLARQMTVIK
ncbi:MAG TPA: choice-of-anchor D domain-containing protein, partial [Candidatus Kapabacteria bacterium]|nr:choice-of-anchor D domain-containing protein [Candidatus Kapabacteria bacterium]